MQGQTLRRLNSRFVPQFFQLIKTGSALSNVREQVGELSVRGPLRKFQQHFAPRTADALRIGKVFMLDPVKFVEQFLFRIHSACPGRTWSPSLTATLPQQNATIHDRDRWKGADGKWLETCSILTTAPNAVTSAAHDRMPVILDADSYDLWLDPGMRDATAASDLLRPCDARLMRCYPSASNVLRTREALGVNATDDCSVPATRAR